MGEVRVQLEVENFVDRVNAGQNGYEEAVRALTIDALVNSGALVNLLPQDVVEYLSVPLAGSAVVTMADERREEMAMAQGITFKVAGRSTTLPCLVGPPRCEALLGQIVLDVLDLVVDGPGNRVIVNPASPIYPSLKLK